MSRKVPLSVPSYSISCSTTFRLPPPPRHQPPTLRKRRQLFHHSQSSYWCRNNPAILRKQSEQMGKWKFNFSGPKSSSVVLTRAYKPGDDPFLNGQWISNAKKVKFLGVKMDAKLLPRQNILSWTRLLPVIPRLVNATLIHLERKHLRL
jgi:hypothetical protein